MIDYDTSDWLWRQSCRLKGSVIPTALVIALPSSLLGVLLVVLREEFDFMSESSELPIFPTTAWSVLALPLTMIIGFRTRQAFQRFWEGTGLLHAMRGEWFDSASCLMTFSVPAKKSKPKEVNDFRHTLLRLMSLCHGSALDEIKLEETESYEVLDLAGLSEDTMNILRECKKLDFNRVEVILHMIQVLVIDAHTQGVIDVPPPILSRVYQTLSRGFVNLLSARKIKDTRFPFPYAQLVSIFLLTFAFVTPWVLATLIQSKVWCGFFTFVPVFALLSLNYTAGQLEMPFGHDANDLPLDKFQSEMNNSLLMLMHDYSDHVASAASTCLRDFDAVREDLETVEVNRSISCSVERARASIFVNVRPSTPQPATPAADPKNPVVSLYSSFKDEVDEPDAPAAAAAISPQLSGSSQPPLIANQESSPKAAAQQLVAQAPLQPPQEPRQQQQPQQQPQQQAFSPHQQAFPPQDEMLQQQPQHFQQPQYLRELHLQAPPPERGQPGSPWQPELRPPSALRLQGLQPQLPFTGVLMLPTGGPTDLSLADVQAKPSHGPPGTQVIGHSRNGVECEPLVTEYVGSSRGRHVLPAIDCAGALGGSSSAKSSWSATCDNVGRRNRQEVISTNAESIGYVEEGDVRRREARPLQGCCGRL